jgi:hypothetical protein
MKETAKFHWSFFRRGGLDQVVLEKGVEIARLKELDQKLWVALACPLKGMEFDARTLELMDAQKDGRIRVPELLAAVDWTVSRLKEPDTLFREEKSLALARIADNEAGRKLQAGARRILADLGRPAAAEISLEDIADTTKIFAQTRFNGDGVVPSESAGDDAETAKAIEEIILCAGSTPDRNGKPGITQAQLDAFLKEAAAYVAWWCESEKSPEILPLGPQTAAAFAAFAAVRVKVEDYFARCRLAAFDGRSVVALECAEAGFAAFAAKSLTSEAEDIAKLPLARVDGIVELSLTRGVNPAWQAALATFCQTVIEPCLGTGATTLSEAQWRQLAARFKPYETWQTAKAGATVEKLGIVRIREFLDGPAAAKIAGLIAEDLALQDDFAQIGELEKLIRFHRDLARFLRNFVNLADFYAPGRTAIFQIGTLFVDGRACELCFHVDDVGKHSLFAGNGRIYLAYCEVSRPATNEKKTICAAVTAGTAESLWVGRHGIFYDRQGNDWDAVIVKVIEHPVSLREAFWMPWKKIVTMVSDQVKKVLAAREQAAMTAALKQIEDTSKQVGAAAVPVPPPPPPPPKVDGAAMASSVAAVGIAVGLLGSAFGALLGAMSNMKFTSILLGVAGVFMLVSGPAVLLAYFKMRARDIAPILNAGGWAVNGKINMTLSLGSRMTHAAELPEGSERRLIDPYADSRWRENLLVIILAFLGVLFGIWKLYSNDCFNAWLPESLQYGHAEKAAKGKEAERQKDIVELSQMLFKGCDANQDGKFSVAEAAAAQTELLKVYDVNKDGKIDADEFRKLAVDAAKSGAAPDPKAPPAAPVAPAIPAAK